MSGGYDFRPVAGWKLNVRQDSGDMLGVVSDRYRVVQNREAFDFCDGLLQDGIIKYESAGAIRGGRIVWLLAQMPERKDEVAEGDSLHRYILLPTLTTAAARPASCRHRCG